VRIAVTGGTGLVGVHAIALLLRDGYPVRALVRNEKKLKAVLAPFDVRQDKLEAVPCDINDASAIAAALEGADALVHCAGIFSNRFVDADLLQRTNVDGARAVLGAAVARKLDPIIHISSYLALFPPKRSVQSADDPVASPKSLYTATKAASERIARSFQDQGAPVVTVYPGSIQGPHDPTYGIGSQLIEQAIRSGTWADAGGGRVYTDVRDLSLLLSRLLAPGLGPRRIMFGGYYLRDAEVAEILGRVVGKAMKVNRVPGGLLRLIGTISDAISHLTKKEFQLTREAAEVLTRSVPTDDSAALALLNGDMVGAEKSFRDLVDWMKSTGRLSVAA
jgi:nucleoside-diphosphate-sugar epimerase